MRVFWGVKDLSGQGRFTRSHGKGQTVIQQSLKSVSECSRDAKGVLKGSALAPISPKEFSKKSWGGRDYSLAVLVRKSHIPEREEKRKTNHNSFLPHTVWESV